MRLRIFQRKGHYHLETARGKSISLRTTVYSEALKKVKSLGIKKPNCPYCGSDMVPSHRKYCSDLCRERFNNETMRHGLPRRAIFEAFKNSCAVCGHNDSLVVYHVDNHGNAVRPNNKNNADKMIVICSGCRHKIKIGKKDTIAGADDLFTVNFYQKLKAAIMREMKATKALKLACKMPACLPADFMQKR